MYFVIIQYDRGFQTFFYFTRRALILNGFKPLTYYMVSRISIDGQEIIASFSNSRDRDRDRDKE